MALQPGETDAKVMLAEVYYRRDDFPEAAASLNGMDPRTAAKRSPLHRHEAAEVGLDTDFARELGVPHFGAV